MVRSSRPGTEMGATLDEEMVKIEEDEALQALSAATRILL